MNMLSIAENYNYLKVLLGSWLLDRLSDSDIRFKIYFLWLSV